MKYLRMNVNSSKSFVKYLTVGSGVKPGVPLPLQVPLDPGGYLEIAVDENTNTLKGKGHNLWFTTDKLEEDSFDYITGELQQMELTLSNLDLAYDPQTGKILSGGGFIYVMGTPSPGAGGALATWYLGPSKLRDGNSPGFDLSDGLGCGGGLLLELGTGNFTNFILHLDTVLAKEDVDGDGHYETDCWPFAKWFKLLYRPPLLRIILPDPPPFPPPSPWMIGMYEAKLSALMNMALKGRKPLEGAPKITQIQVSSDSRVVVVLFDQDGAVLSGDLSDRSVKTLQINPENFAHLSLGIGMKSST